MDCSKIYCPGGIQSQSGIASQSGVACVDRYKDAVIESNGESIKDIPKFLEEVAGPHVVPIWNSHQGGIPAAEFLWERMENADIKIYDIWAKEIEFDLVARKSRGADIKSIISVIVAEKQCSKFLKDYEFQSALLTTTAFDTFMSRNEIDAVLIAPQSKIPDDLEVVSKNVENKNNFTTFVKFNSEKTLSCKKQYYLTAISLRPLDSILTDEEQTLIQNLFENRSSVSEMPKLIFVLRRVDKVSLLLEGEKLETGDLLNSEEQLKSGIKIYEEVGTIDQLYSEQLSVLVDSKFPDLNHEFLLHKGEKTYLFACPILGIYTHGYEQETVEPVIRFYIHKLFEAIENGLICNPDQESLFKKHRESWLKANLEFIKFTIVI